MKISYEQMKEIYLGWLRDPIGSQTEIFKKYKWSRLRFFDEASRRGDSV